GGGARGAGGRHANHHHLQGGGGGTQVVPHGPAAAGEPLSVQARAGTDACQTGQLMVPQDLNVCAAARSWIVPQRRVVRLLPPAASLAACLPPGWRCSSRPAWISLHLVGRSPGARAARSPVVSG